MISTIKNRLNSIFTGVQSPLSGQRRTQINQSTTIKKQLKQRQPRKSNKSSISISEVKNKEVVSFEGGAGEKITEKNETEEESPEKKIEDE